VRVFDHNHSRIDHGAIAIAIPPNDICWRCSLPIHDREGGRIPNGKLTMGDQRDRKWNRNSAQTSVNDDEFLISRSRKVATICGSVPSGRGGDDFQPFGQPCLQARDLASPRLVSSAFFPVARMMMTPQPLRLPQPSPVRFLNRLARGPKCTPVVARADVVPAPRPTDGAESV